MIDVATLARATIRRRTTVAYDEALVQRAGAARYWRASASAKHPVMIAGTGVTALPARWRSSSRRSASCRIPVTTAWTHDLIDGDDELYCGRPGTIGDRAGNFTVQNADLVLVLGSRLNLRQVSYNWNSFAREPSKFRWTSIRQNWTKPLVKPDLAIAATLSSFWQTSGNAGCRALSPASRGLDRLVPPAGGALSCGAGAAAAARTSAESLLLHGDAFRHAGRAMTWWFAGTPPPASCPSR